MANKAEALDLIDRLLDDKTEDLDEVQKCATSDDPDTVTIKAELSKDIELLTFIRDTLTENV